MKNFFSVGLQKNNIKVHLKTNIHDTFPTFYIHLRGTTTEL